jgi:hypothetical protein
MEPEHVKRLLMLISFLIALVCLIANLARGSGLLHASFAALCVMLTSALILLVTARAMVKVLAQFVRDGEITDRR